MKIKDLQNEEKPREKMLAVGAENLTDVELLSIILRSGGKNKSVVSLSRELISKFGGLRKLLSSDIDEILSLRDVSVAKATSIKALEEISKRYLHPTGLKKRNIKNPEDAYEVIKKDILNKEEEYLFLLTLDGRGRMISKDLISKGTLNETLIHPREIFKKALSKNAYSIILVHNHPSNNPEPSEDDIKVTKRIFKVGTNIGIPLIDHIVASDDKFVSMRSRNLMST